MDAIPYPGLREILSGITSSGGSISLVSGRSAFEVAQLLALDPLPEIWGCHGWECLRPDIGLEQLPLSSDQLNGLTKAIVELQGLGLEDRLETKYGSLAIHWRGLPEAEANRIRRLSGDVMKPVAGWKLALREFDGGLELRALGRDKGSAVRSILASNPKDAFCAYLGDDQTDEDAFVEVKKAGGLALLVRPETRPTNADSWIVPPDELLDFLHRWKSLLKNGPNPRTV